MSKYVIKNCPNCLTYNRPKAICGLTYKTGGFKGETTSYKHCQDCTDCVMKQIVKLCVNEIIYSDRWSESRAFAKELLDTIAIQEVE